MKLPGNLIENRQKHLTRDHDVHYPTDGVLILRETVSLYSKLSFKYEGIRYIYAVHVIVDVSGDVPVTQI